MGIGILNNSLSPFIVKNIRLSKGDADFKFLDEDRNVNAGEMQHFHCSVVKKISPHVKIMVEYDEGKEKESGWIQL